MNADGLPTGSTQLLGIIGDPIAQVRSPEVWSALFRLNGVDAVCAPMQVAPWGLAAFLEGAKALRNFLGLIVTIPHKAASLEHVARLTERAARVGAVNVIRLTDELDNYRELAASTLDVYLTQVNNNLSVIMKRLTGVTVILAGIGAIAGIFGMSEAGTAVSGAEQGGFWAITAVMVLLAVGAAFVLRRIGWI